jgi:hypothetical protein
MKLFSRMVKIILPALVLSLSLAPSLAAARESTEREKLLQEKAALETRIVQLRQEQDFLLFQKVASSYDSKYLILHLGAGTGELRYKTRVLKNFAFRVPGERADRVRRGTIALTQKIDGPKRYGLIFGKDLIIRGKNRLTSLEADIPPLSLQKKDLMAVFRALEPGAQAYVLP